MRRENVNFFSIYFFHNKNYQFMPKIVVVEHRDHFYRIPQVISDQNTLFQWKKNWRGWIFYHIKFFNFLSLFFLQQPLPLCIFFNVAANKLSPIGINLFLLLSRHIKHSNLVGIQMLCKQGGQNMNLFIGCRVFYGLDGTAVEWRPKGDHSPKVDLEKQGP